MKSTKPFIVMPKRNEKRALLPIGGERPRRDDGE